MADLTQMTTKTLSTAVVDMKFVTDSAWIEIKEKLGIFNEGDLDFFVWVEEIDTAELSDESYTFLENVLELYSNDVDILTFR